MRALVLLPIATVAMSLRGGSDERLNVTANSALASPTVTLRVPLNDRRTRTAVLSDPCSVSSRTSARPSSARASYTQSPRAPSTISRCEDCELAITTCVHKVIAVCSAAGAASLVPPATEFAPAVFLICVAKEVYSCTAAWELCQGNCPTGDRCIAMVHELERLEAEGQQLQRQLEEFKRTTPIPDIRTHHRECDAWTEYVNELIQRIVKNVDALNEAHRRYEKCRWL